MSSAPGVTLEGVAAKGPQHPVQHALRVLLSSFPLGVSDPSGDMLGSKWATGMPGCSGLWIHRHDRPLSSPHRRAFSAAVAVPDQGEIEILPDTPDLVRPARA